MDVCLLTEMLNFDSEEIFMPVSSLKAKKKDFHWLLNIMTFCSLGFSSCCSSNRGRKD